MVSIHSAGYFMPADIFLKNLYSLSRIELRVSGIEIRELFRNIRARCANNGHAHNAERRTIDTGRITMDKGRRTMDETRSTNNEL